MGRAHTWLFAGVLGVAAIGGGTAWKAGYFSPRAEVVPAIGEALAIEGVNERLEVRLRDQIQLTGFLQRGKDYYVAIVNSQVVELGDVVVIDTGSERHELRVESISEDRVVLRKL